MSGPFPVHSVFPFHPSCLFSFLLLTGGTCFCCCSVGVGLFATPWTTICQGSLPFTISRSLLKLMFIESVMLSDYLIISSSAIPFSFCLQSFPASGYFSMSWIFTSGGQSIGVWCSFSISPSSEYSGLISFRIDWFDLVVQGTLKSLLQHHSSKASILQHSAFFMAQISHLYTTTGKTIALTI